MPNRALSYGSDGSRGTTADQSFLGLARLAFGLALTVPALLGIGLLFVAHSLPRGSLAHDVVRDLGIGAFVSVIITVVIEFYARNRLQAEIRSGVIEAAVARLVPERVWEKIKIEVLSQDTIRRNWTLIMNVVDDPTLGEGRYRSETVQSYELHNLTGRETTVLVQHELYTHIAGREAAGEPLPRFVRVTVGPKHYEGAELQGLLENGGLKLELRVPLPADEAGVPVRLELKEIIRAHDTFVWWMTNTTDRATVEISAPDNLRFSLRAPFHHGPLQEITPGRRWTFPGIIALGQGLEFLTELQP